MFTGHPQRDARPLPDRPPLERWRCPSTRDSQDCSQPDSGPVLGTRRKGEDEEPCHRPLRRRQPRKQPLSPTTRFCERQEEARDEPASTGPAVGAHMGTGLRGSALTVWHCHGRDVTHIFPNTRGTEHPQPALKGLWHFGDRVHQHSVVHGRERPALVGVQPGRGRAGAEPGSVGALGTF